MIKDQNSKKGFYTFPALNTKAVDTIELEMLPMLMLVCS